MPEKFLPVRDKRSRSLGWSRDRATVLEGERQQLANFVEKLPPSPNPKIIWRCEPHILSLMRGDSS